MNYNILVSKFIKKKFYIPKLKMCTTCNGGYKKNLEEVKPALKQRKPHPIQKICGTGPEPSTCNNGKIVLFYDDFKCGFFPGECGSKYEFFVPATGPLKSNDAAGGVDGCAGKLCINSSPFRTTSNSYWDKVKFLVYQKEAYNAPKLGAELVYEAIVSVQQTGVDLVPVALQATGAPANPLNGVSNVYEDHRLAYAGINATDKENGLMFDFAISNANIFAYYEKTPQLPRNPDPAANFDAWNHLVPVGKRNIANPAEDFVKLAIAYNYKENYVRWIINDEEVYRINRLGYPLQRKYRGLEFGTVGQLPDPVTLTRPKALSFGFGTFTNFANYNPINPGQFDNSGLIGYTDLLTEAVNPIVTSVNGNLLAYTALTPYASLVVPQGYTGTNFGQGVNLCLKYVCVYILAPEEVHRAFKGIVCCESRILETRCCQNSLNGVNSADDLIATKCKGKINDCDPCYDPLVPNACCQPCPPCPPGPPVPPACESYQPHPPKRC